MDPVYHVVRRVPAEPEESNTSQEEADETWEELPRTG